MVFINLHSHLRKILLFQLLYLYQEDQCQCLRCGQGSLPKTKRKKTQSKTLQYHKSSRLWLHASHCPEHSVTRLKIQWKCLSLNTGAIFIYQCDRSERQREKERAFWAFCLWRVFSDLCSSKTFLLTCHGLVCVGLMGLHSQSCAAGYQPAKRSWTSLEPVRENVCTYLTTERPPKPENDMSILLVYVKTV